MKWLSLTGLTLICVFVGFAPEMAAYYVTLLNPGQIEIIESEVKTEPCLETSETSTCTTKFTIDLKPYKDKYPDLAVGSGFIIYATRYYCDNRSLVAEFDDPKHPGRNFEVFNIYQTYFVHSECNTLEIEAWGHPTAVRKGKIAGLFVIGNVHSITLLKQVSEFFRSGIYQVFSFCFLFLLFLSLFLKKALPDLKPNEIDYSLPWWIISALSNAGVFQILLPTNRWPHWQNRLGAIALLTSLSVNFLSAYDLGKRRNHALQIICATIACALILNANFAEHFSASLFVIAAAGFLISLERRNQVLLFLSLFVLAAGLKIRFNFFLPNPMIIYFFVGLVALRTLLLRLRIAAGFSWFLTFVSKFRAHSNFQDSALIELINNAKAVANIPYATILRVLPDSKIEICQFHEAISRFYVESIPPVFAHAISLRSEIWHLRADTPEYLKIRKDIPHLGIKKGNYFSIIPIYDEDEMFGAIAITGYPDEYAQMNEQSACQRAAIRIAAEQIKSIFKMNEGRMRNEWTTIANEFFSKTKERESGHDLGKMAEMLSTIGEASVFIAELDKKTEKFILRGIHGYHPYVHDRLTQGTLYAKADNLQGPIALAVNRRKAVIVQDVTLLKQVLHENSNLFFEYNETKSCAGVPIFTNDSNEVWGVLWIERRASKHPITLLAESALNNVAAYIGRSVSLNKIQDEATKTKKALEVLMPKHLYHDVVHNNKTEEKDYGYVVMLDLKGSTRAAAESGPARFHQAVGKLLPIIKNAASEYGLTLQEYEWDAFVFTISARQPSREHTDAILAFCESITASVEDWYTEEVSPILLAARQIGAKFRICVSFGDISRGFRIVDGVPGAWTFLGSEIAAVSKLEAECKKLDGVLFMDESAAHKVNFDDFINTGKHVPSTERRIYCHSASWPMLLEASSRKGKIRTKHAASF